MWQDTDKQMKTVQKLYEDGHIQKIFNSLQTFYPGHYYNIDRPPMKPLLQSDSWLIRIVY